MDNVYIHKNKNSDLQEIQTGSRMLRDSKSDPDTTM